MKAIKAKMSILALLIICVCVPAYAHHGNAAYEKTTIQLQGTVTKFMWINPHTILMFDVKDDKGNVAHWAAEAGSPSALQARGGGWYRDAVKPGDKITVILFPAKDGSPVGRFQRIIFPDGKMLHDSQDVAQN
jgi:hypothetical protein